jgi:hypothetical protein
LVVRQPELKEEGREGGGEGGREGGREVGREGLTQGGTDPNGVDLFTKALVPKKHKSNKVIVQSVIGPKDAYRLAVAVAG